jgi:hypothetical protein
MSRKQRIILAVFALIDTLVIALLGYVVVSERNRVSTNSNVNSNPTPVEQASDPCSTHLLDALTVDSRYRPAIAYKQRGDELRVTLHALDASSKTKDFEGEQSLWTALTIVAPHLARLCPSAETLIVLVENPTPQGPAYHIARLPAPAVSDWVDGALSDDQLAETAHYRYVQSRPQTPP